jgi:hypothetical protein
MNEEVLKHLYEFANANDLVLEKHGEIGFGRPCVGFVKGESYIAYNPYNSMDFERIPEFYDKRLSEAATENAYHKDDYMAVLVHDDKYEDALVELERWLTNLEKLGKVRVKEYATGATGIQAMFSGLRGYALTIDKE